MSRRKKGIKNISYVLFFTPIKLLMTFWSRQIIIQYLGTELVGLNATLTNILGFLNLGELGVSIAVSLVLYKALFEGKRNEISDIISIFGFLYRRIGFIILGVGLIVSLFLPWIFKNQSISLWYIYLGFYSYLLVSLLGYFYNYKQAILDADQKSFVLQIINNTISIFKSFLQIIALKIFLLGYVSWILIEIIFAIINTICITLSIKKYYPWLKSSYKQGKIVFKKYSNIITLIKQIISHKFAGFVLGQTDNIIIYFVTNSLILVTCYSNYALIITSIHSIIGSILGILQSSIGNLIAEGNKEKIKKIFWELQAICFIIASAVGICLIYLINPFVTLWVGNSFILSSIIVGLLIVNIFIGIFRIPVGLYLTGYSIVRDTWAPWTEAAINLVFSIIAGFYWGIAGVLLGTFWSLILIVILWKPYFLYIEGFKESVWIYWKTIFKYLILSTITLGIIHFVIIPFTPFEYNNFLHWTMNASIILVSTLITLVILMYLFDKYTKHIIKDFVIFGHKIIKSIYKK